LGGGEQPMLPKGKASKTQTTKEEDEVRREQRQPSCGHDREQVGGRSWASRAEKSIFKNANPSQKGGFLPLTKKWLE